MLWVPMGEASAGLLHPTSSVEAITFQHTLKVCLEDRQPRKYQMLLLCILLS